MSPKKRIQYEWSISIYKGESPDQMKPAESVQIPTLTAKHITDADAGFVADPFMMYKDGKWYMFYEVLNQANGLGEIACSSSHNLESWEYEGMALVEPFHLSYPMVFESNGTLYMVPETRQAGQIRLYEAQDFPTKWKQVSVLVEGDYADATPFRYKDGWWMYALNGTKTLHLYFAQDLKGPWHLHPSSPIVENDLRTSRPAGRVIQYEDKLFRLAQDGIPLYGSRVRMMEVLRLSETDYQEVETESSPVLKGSRKGWNAIAMHHMDAQQMADGFEDFDYGAYCGEISQQMEIREVELEEFVKLLETDVHVLDVREEYELPRIEHSNLIVAPLPELEGFIDRLEKEKDVIVVCQHGVRSLRAIDKLQTKYDFKNLINLKGGVNNYGK